MNHDRRRRTPPPSWFHRATHGWGPVIFCLGILAVGFFSAAASDYQTRELAYQVADQGRRTSSTDVEVHVTHHTGKGGDYWEVDDVRAVLPTSPYPVTLQGVQFTDDLPDNYPEGWQRPNRLTGFTPPLEVRVLYDGDGTVLAAMAAKDVAFWTQSNHHPEWEAFAGTASVGLAALIMVVNHRRRRPGTRVR